MQMPNLVIIVINSSSSFVNCHGQDASASAILFNGLKKLVIER
jgi:hypothetical protein